MLNAVIFDMDGVIVDSEPLHHKAYKKMFADFEIEVSDALFETFTGEATLAICQKICENFKLDVPPEKLVQRKREYFNRLFDEDKELELIEGVSDLIEEYHNAGLTLVLASSASMQNIYRIFKRFDLDRYFIAKLSGADLKASKPHPEIFIKATQASGFAKEHCFVIEDSTNGIKAAKAAGLFCVGFDSPNSKNQEYSQADLRINSYKEIEYLKIKTFF